ncbi:uncharacterized protein LOC143541539 [Bidens hawaiensis]|uniref:uncharacterized protein LOC143541539 n=1 Tax=Bidens hawaiensis TaxID=980011 RepID=UPI00404A2E4F
MAMVVVLAPATKIVVAVATVEIGVVVVNRNDGGDGDGGGCSGGGGGGGGGGGDGGGKGNGVGGMLHRRCWRSADDFGTGVGDVHVLAVDDSLVDRKVIERLLKITSCKVTAVESGRRALQYLGLLDQDKTTTSILPRGLKVDLIITDYCMPGMTGYELLKKIKGSATFREVPVVIMSSENVLARIDRCLEEGVEDFIVKPVKLSDVKRLKDYIFGSTTNTNTIRDAASNSNNNKQEKAAAAAASFNKRKLQEMSHSHTPPSSASPSPPTTSPSASPSPSPSASPSPSPPTISPSASTSPSPLTISSSASPSPPAPSLTPPLSPSQLDSPTMRLKVTNSDQA